MDLESLNFAELRDAEIVARMRKFNYEKFKTLVRMHLSFALDLNTDEFDLPCHEIVYEDKGKIKKWNRLSKKHKHGVVAAALATGSAGCASVSHKSANANCNGSPTEGLSQQIDPEVNLQDSTNAEANNKFTSKTDKFVKNISYQNSTSSISTSNMTTDAIKKTPNSYGLFSNPSDIYKWKSMQYNNAVAADETTTFKNKSINNDNLKTKESSSSTSESFMANKDDKPIANVYPLLRDPLTTCTTISSNNVNYFASSSAAPSLVNAIRANNFISVNNSLDQTLKSSISTNNSSTNNSFDRSNFHNTHLNMIFEEQATESMCTIQQQPIRNLDFYKKNEKKKKKSCVVS